LEELYHAENTDPYKGNDGKIPSNEYPILGKIHFSEKLEMRNSTLWE
jgi:hypothetical protein